jgi:transposase-like protein
MPYDPQTYLDHFTADTAPGPDELVMQMEEYDDHDEPEGIELGGIESIPANALAILLRAILPANANPSANTYWRQSAVKLAAISWSCLPEIRVSSQCAIAEGIGVTRASLNFWIVKFRDLGGVASFGGKCQSARQVLSKAQRRSWRERHEADGAAHGEHEGENQLDRATELEQIYGD